MSFRIRPFQKADFETLWSIDQICFDPQLAYSRIELAFYMRRPGSFSLVAELCDNGQKPRIAGFIVAEIERKGKRGGRNGHIITIDVLPETRRSGVGSALLAAAERQLADGGATAVSLETAVNNDSAIRFYRSKGYLVEATTPRYYSNQLDAFVMKKELLKTVASSE